MDRYLFLVAVCLVLTSCGKSSAPTTATFAQPLGETTLPEPPQQASAWNAPAGVSSNLLSAVTTLFQQGFPDPRGCEYCEIEVEVSGVWGSQHIADTRGWVLPTSAGATQSFAICWNAVIYPVKKVGRQVDLHAEAANAPPQKRSRVNLAVSEVSSVFLTNSSSTRVSLLLRCGETEAALRMWSVADGQKSDPYLEMAGDWAWALFDHIISAHMRGDTAAALASARRLAEVHPRIEAEAARRGFVQNESSGQAPNGSYLSFLSQLPELVADLERRAREPQKKRITEKELAQIAARSKRINVLIDALDLVQARQWSQPGGVDLAEDPVVAALINEGDAAVEPLLVCLEKDKRLTQSVRFHRTFFRNREVLPVQSAARAALQHILQVQFVSPSEFRRYWERHKSVKLEERWFATLKDDKADPEEWLQAAANIVQPQNVTGVPGSHFSTVAPIASGEKPKLRGEVLRSKWWPSVSGLLLKRANVMAKKAQALDQRQGVDALRKGCKFVNALVEWEGASAAIVPARSLMRRTIEFWQDERSFTMSSGHDLARFIAQLTQVRVLGGETKALIEYASWIKAATPKKIGWCALAAFEPLWRNSSDPTVLSVSDWLFNDPGSPWRELPWQGLRAEEPILSDLVKLPAFRRLLLRELDRREVQGSIEYTANDTVQYQLANFGGGSRGPWPQPKKPVPGTKVELRRCDAVAWCLSNGKHIPFFDPFATVEQRDEAIERAKAALSSPDLGAARK